MKNKLTREECEKVFDNLKYQYQDGHKVDVSSIYDKDFEIINQLIEEHFELVELIEKWGLSDFSIEELDKWRDRCIWHVKKVNEMHDEIKTLEKEIEELKSNPPLKFEEMNDDMWIWDNEEKMYIHSINNYESKEYGKGLRIKYGFDLIRWKYEENRFYRKQVK